MLHFLLLALKIIGIIILAVLCIILAVLVIILVTPLRYYLHGLAAFEGKKIEGDVRLTWLFKLIRVDIQFQEMKLAWRLKIAWKTIMQDGFEDKTDKKTEVTHNERKDSKPDELIEDLYQEDQPAESSTVESSAVESSSEGNDHREDEPDQSESSSEGSCDGESSSDEDKPSSERSCDGESSSDEESDQSESSSEGSGDGKGESDSEPDEGESNTISKTEEADEEGTSKEKESTSEKVEKEPFDYEKVKEKILQINEKIKTPFRKIDKFQKTLESKLNSLEKKIQQLTALKDELLDFIYNKTHQKAFFKILKSLKYIIKKYLPRKGEARFHFGLDDPYLTGTVFAIISILDPLCGGNIYATPEPDRFMIEGELSMKGRIRLVHILIALLSIAITPAVWRTLLDAKKLSILKK